ncbi:hypothetical protein RHMOL_Rhmol02G0283300 [Rhododendron molle]|uniref:Uncharacterized protein n=1 Tax=Rhododendron molle TaxID=49168 RepID=A0ACC0PWU2_RHOML|nr:hypothetical protein RHMOL_Rhmol02G0283300 [Rhododendron molle]
MSDTCPGHKVGLEGPSQDTIAAGRDPAPAGIDRDLVAWWLKKKGLSREGRTCEMCLREVTSPLQLGELLQDILIHIAERVDFLEDFLSFGRVYRSWRSVAVKENFKGTQQLPWLMLAEDDNSDYRRFVSAPEGNPIDNLLLPEAKGKWCFETLGWLVTLSETGDMNLLPPMSRIQIPLPHISTFKYYLEGNMPNNFLFIQKAVLSSRPYVSSKENNFVLMVIHEGCGYLGFWKPGDKA